MITNLILSNKNALPVLCLAAMGFSACSNPTGQSKTPAAGESIIPPRPNIVILLTDDQGYGDMRCYGNPRVQTPNLDKLASEGTRFTDFYAGAAASTPSRAALLTKTRPGWAAGQADR